MQNSSWTKIIKFSLPMTLVGILDLVLILINFIWIYIMIGDANALSALRISSSIITLIEAIMVGIVSSQLVYVSQHIGAEDMSEAKRGVRSSFSFALYSGIAVTLLGLIFLPLLINLYGNNAATGVYTKDYLTIYLIGYVFMSLNNLLLLLPRFFQKVKLIYQGTIISIVVNVVATPVFMIIFKNMGYSMISGAAIGAIAANVSCALYLLWKIFLRDALKVGLSRLYLSLKIDYKLLHKIKGYISTQVINGLTYNVSAFLYLLILSYYPLEVFNVYAVATYVYSFFGIVAQNFAVSLIPLVSNYIGGKQYFEIRHLVKRMVWIQLCFSLGIAAIIMVSHHAISSYFAPNIDLVPLFSEFLLIYSVPWALNMVSVIFIFVAKGSGDSKGSLLLTILNMYVIVLVCIFTVPYLFDNLTTGVFVALGLIPTLSFITSSIYYLSGRWTKATLVKNKESAIEAS